MSFMPRGEMLRYAEEVLTDAENNPNHLLYPGPEKKQEQLLICRFEGTCSNNVIVCRDCEGGGPYCEVKCPKKGFVFCDTERIWKDCPEGNNVRFNCMQDPSQRK